MTEPEKLRDVEPLNPEQKPLPSSPAPETQPEALLLCFCENVLLARLDIDQALKGSGFTVDYVEADSRRMPDLANKPYRLLLFDIRSKADVGFQSCAMIRSRTDLPIMLILRGGARSEVMRGYQAGADAYMLVPFDPREFAARLNGLLRRSPQHLQDQ